MLLSGDTASCPPAWTAEMAPNLLIHEATFNEQQDKAHQHLHSTAAGAVQTARSIRASFLALTHYGKIAPKPAASVEEAHGGRRPPGGCPQRRRPVEGQRQGQRVTHLAWGSDGWKATSTEPHR